MGTMPSLIVVTTVLRQRSGLAVGSLSDLI